MPATSLAPIVQLAGTASRPPWGRRSRWLRQPRHGTHSQGFGAYREDGAEWEAAFRSRRVTTTSWTSATRKPTASQNASASCL
jgi:hypothetical protein